MHINLLASLAFLTLNVSSFPPTDPGKTSPQAYGRSSVKFGGGKTFLPEIMYEILTKCPNFLHYVCPKKIFPGFQGVQWGRATLLHPVSYAYGWAPGPPPAKSGPGLSVSVMLSFCSHIGVDSSKLITTLSQTNVFTLDGLLQYRSNSKKRNILIFQVEQGRI